MDKGAEILEAGPREFSRAGLVNTMQNMLQKPFVMIIAPSGYGKTMFVRNFFQKNAKLRYIWFAMEMEEVDESWVWRKLCGKIGEEDEALYQRLRELELPKSRQEIRYFTQILREHMRQPIFLVIDDYQECNSPALDHMLSAVILEELPKLHIILISRTYPNISYEEMILKGCCEVLNQRNLTLSEEETAEIFRLNGVELPGEELSQLYRYTDGWIAAVYLSLYEYRKMGGLGYFTGVNRLLKAVVFDKLSPQLRTFYMKLSLLDRFDMEGARYITEMEIYEEAVYESVESFGFIQYDAGSRSFEMYALLRTVARAELEKSGIDIERLYERAGEWFEQKRSYIKAVQYYQKIKKWDSILEIYSGEMRNTVLEQAPEICESVMREVPVEAVRRHAIGGLNYLYYTIMKKSKAAGKKYYEKTEREFAVDWEKKENQELKGEMMVIRSMLQFNDLEQMTESLREAYRLLGRKNSNVLGEALLTYGTTCMTLLYYNKPGRLARTIELEKEYAKYYMRLTGGGQEGWDEFFDAEYALMKGEVDKAYVLAERVCKKTLLRKQICVVISCYYMIFRCLIYYGKRDEFESRMKEFKEMLAETVRPVLIMDMEMAYSYAYACLGQPEEMAEWISQFHLDNCSRLIRNIRSGCITYGLMLSRTGRWELLETIGEQLLVPYEETVHVNSEIVGYIYKAIANYHMDHAGEALRYLKQAIAIAEKDEVRIPFIEYSVELSALLRRLESSEFIASLEPLIRQYQNGLKSWREPGGRREQLTAREQELMGYVRAGYRNNEISAAMNIALVTVEKNLTNIYRKLRVSNRAAAIARLDELK